MHATAQEGAGDASYSIVRYGDNRKSRWRCTLLLSSGVPFDDHQRWDRRACRRNRCVTSLKPRGGVTTVAPGNLS
jgi:hypothetical protein